MGRIPWILGLSLSHNGAACLMRGEAVVVAVQEERLNRQKRSRISFAEPCLSARYCLDAAGISASDLDLVVLCVQGSISSARAAFSSNRILGASTPVQFVSHHIAHAASCVAWSGEMNMGILVIDERGSPHEDLSAEEKGCVVDGGPDDWECISSYRVDGHSILPLEKHLAPKGQSRIANASGMPYFFGLGGMYSAVAEQVFGDSMEGGKVMGLAGYGVPTFPVSDFFDIKDGRLSYHRTASDKLVEKDRWPAHRVLYQNLAASVQQALEFGVIHHVRRLMELSGTRKIGFAGGVALNCLANQKILTAIRDCDLFVVPPADDAGTALGAAYLGARSLLGRLPRSSLSADSLGRVHGRADVMEAITDKPWIVGSTGISVPTEVVRRLEDGQIGGWLEGGSEFGPRALGHRSIIADPRRPDMKQQINERVKCREMFRPFAPAVLLTEVENWFDLQGTPATSPYMLRVVKPRLDRCAQVPAISHVDGTARIQTISAENGRFFDLLTEFFSATKIPMLVNTSFNVASEPIVESPEDAVWCMIESGLNFCVLEDVLVTPTSRPFSIDYVRPRATSASSVRPIMRGAQEAGAILSVETRWGPHSVYVPSEVRVVIDACNGGKTAREVLAALRRTCSFSLDVRIFTTLLFQLRRDGLITMES